MNVQRLLKSPTDPQKIHLKEGIDLDSKVRVNHMIRKRPYGARDKEELISSIELLHNKGYSQVEIAKELKISRGTILRWNKEIGFIQSRSPGDAGKLKSKVHPYDENYFADVHTANQAYLVGYILGDGTVVDRKKSKRLVLSLAEQDQQLLFDIAKELNMTGVIKFRKANAQNEQNKYSLLISSTKICNDLIKIGVTSNKTGKEKWIDFKDEKMQWSFLRGFFDADGHIRVYKRNGYLKTRVGFTGSKEMMESILKFLKQYGIGLNVNAIYAKQGCFDVHFSSLSEVKVMYSYLYHYGDIKLNRKYEKFSSLMI